MKLGWNQAKISQRACVFEHCVKLQISRNDNKQLTVKNVNSVWSGFFSVFWYRSIDQQVYLFFCYESKPFCHPNINFNLSLESLKSVLKIGEYPRIFPSFSWGIFAHVTRLDQSRESENIWWIIRKDMVFKPYLPTLTALLLSSLNDLQFFFVCLYALLEFSRAKHYR